jgi:hypothetical protein
VNGAVLVTWAETSRVGSISQREPVGEVGSRIGRNALGSTSELIEAFTGDWSDSRCGLKPAPIESIAVMIWVALGAGAADWVVSVLCGAGGGSTAHPPSKTTAMPHAPACSLRGPVSTPHSVSAGRSRPD